MRQGPTAVGQYEHHKKQNNTNQTQNERLGEYD